MITKIAQYKDRSKFYYKITKVVNVDIMVDEYILCKYLGYDDYSSFMRATGSRSDISEEVSRRIIKRYLNRLNEEIFEELLNGNKVHLKGFLWMAISKVKHTWVKKVVKYFGSHYNIMYRRNILHIKRFKRKHYIFMTKKGQDKLLNRLRNGQSYGNVIWDE